MARLAGSAKLLRAMNESAALGHLLDNGALTRNDLRELTGLSKPTTSEVLRRLTEAGLALVTGHTSGGPGPNAEIYAANPDAAYAVAVSVRESTNGRPALAIAISDLTGTTRARAELAVDFDTTTVEAAIRDAVITQCAEAGVPTDRLRRVQLGVPGSYDPRTDTIHHVHVPGLGRPGLVGELRRALRTPIGVDNDVNLAAVAERRRGVAGAADSFALLWFGEGLGLAIDLGGTLLRGASGGAGEIGYMPLGLFPSPDLRPDLHDVVGGRAVLALAKEHGIDATTPGQAVIQASPAMLAALAERIAVGLAVVVAVLDPALVVLAGEVGQAGGTALRDAVLAATRNASPLDTEIAVTGLVDDAVLLGALDAALADVREELIRNLHDLTR
ncbi:MAG: XylR family transcriptional regulator [Actinobacteria bacterium 13_2_20CM_2_71_6]|nr:MAG: XylR family transcriptional regulator [Actinobacteria bacterium 13_2_20CM_2_71_6]